MSRTFLISSLLAQGLFQIATAWAEPPLPTSKHGSAGSPAPYSAATNSAERDFVSSQQELSTSRAAIDSEKIPLNEELLKREQELRGLQEEYEPLIGTINQLELDATNQKNANKIAVEENNYLANSMDEYGRGFEAKLNPAEIQRYKEAVATARSAPENASLSTKEKLLAQTGLLKISLERLRDILGGSIFKGTAADKDGVLSKGTFAIFGPLAYYASEDGKTSGVASLKLGSPNPVIANVPQEMQNGIIQLATTGTGNIPLDASLGSAIKELTKNNGLVEKFIHGGPIMWPMLAVSVLVMAVALQRFFFIIREKSRRRPKDVHALLAAVEKGDLETASRIGSTTTDYVARSLGYAIDHAENNISDALSLAAGIELKRLKWGFTVLDTCITAAPMLGLLGTVMGMMRTFDSVGADTGSSGGALTGGIAEALIATAFGIVIALAGLLPFNYLNGMVEEAEHELESASTRLEMIVQKQGEAVIKARALQLAIDQDEPVGNPSGNPAPSAT